MAKKTKSLVSKSKLRPGTGNPNGIVSAVGKRLYGTQKFAKMGKKNG